MNNWENWGLVGLYEQERKGRKRLFDKKQQETIKFNLFLLYRNKWKEKANIQKTTSSYQRLFCHL